MNRCRLLLLAALAAAAAPAAAQEDISGTWSGELTVAPDTSVEIHFVLTREADGSYSAVVTSPDPGGIQNMPATSTSFEAGRLAIAVDRLSGRYEGQLVDGRFDGDWYQQDTSIPLDLAPYVKPVLGDAEKDLLRGSWVGKLMIPQGSLTIVFRFEDNDDGELVGFLDSPDQGANGIAVANIEFDNGQLTFRIPQINGEYSATVTDDSMQGTFTQGQGLPLNMTRGEYAPQAPELSDAAIERLEGSWLGELRNAAGIELATVFRFERDENGQFSAFLDSPEQGVVGMPVTELTLEDDQLSLRVPAVQGRFTGTLTDSKIEGTWSQGPASIPLTLTPGEFKPTVTPLDLSDEAVQQLAGVWRGQMGPIELSIRITRSADGEPVAFLDVPAQRVNGMPITEASFDGAQVTLGIPKIMATYSGTISQDAISGQWHQGQVTNELKLTRDP